MRGENLHLEHCLSAVFSTKLIGSHICTLRNTDPTFQTVGLCFGFLFATLVLLCISINCFLFHSLAFVAVIPAALSDQDASLKSTIYGFIGGGCSRIPWMVIQPYVVSTPSTLDDRSHVRFVDFVEKVNIELEAYPYDQFVHADIPLKLATQVLSITIARHIASSHGISAGSRCSVAQLSLLVEQHETHECTNCLSYLTVFSVERDSKKKGVIRTTTYRERKARSDLTACDDSKSTEFPPSPFSIKLEHAIIKDACKRMDPVNFEEVGCAVCGELRQQAKKSHLKSVKNFISVLEAPGVTRIERATNVTPVKEFRGPVLDYSCSAICDDC